VTVYTSKSSALKKKVIEIFCTLFCWSIARKLHLEYEFRVCLDKSHVVAQYPPVVAQLVKATGGYHQTEDAAVLGSNPAPLTVSWTGPGNMTVYYKTNFRVGGVPAWVKTIKKVKIARYGTYTVVYSNESNLIWSCLACK
jgi:hypothetical protein